MTQIWSLYSSKADDITKVTTINSSRPHRSRYLLCISYLLPKLTSKFQIITLFPVTDFSGFFFNVTQMHDWESGLRLKRCLPRVLESVNPFLYRSMLYQSCDFYCDITTQLATSRGFLQSVGLLLASLVLNKITSVSLNFENILSAAFAAELLLLSLMPLPLPKCGIYEVAHVVILFGIIHLKITLE